MPAFKDLTGKKFGRLTVKYQINNILGRTAWMCKCDCNCENNYKVIGKNLLNGSTRSCGCLRKETVSNRSRKVLTGKKFGELEVIKYSHTEGKKAYWECLCSCGRTTIKYAHYLLTGDTKTCGECKIRYLVDERPDLIKEWDFEKNKIDINEIGFSSNKKIWWICPKCNKSYESRLNSRTNNNSGCPRCNKSKGENFTTKILIKNNIEFEEQKTFDGCKDKAKLRFDFYLPKYNMCIEYQGKQHYSVWKWNIPEQELENLQRRDQIKRDFCKSENIRLLEIPYWEIKNIEAILVKELNLSPTPPE